MDNSGHQTDQQTEWARELRQMAIKAEKRLWNQFRLGNKLGLKIRRQHPFGPYFFDFYCFKAKLALEIDGSSHEGCEDYDARRDAYALSRGVKTLRFSPRVADQDIDLFAAWFREECNKRFDELKEK